MAKTARPGSLAIVAYLKRYPRTWVSALEFEKIADARLSARTCISEARGVIELEGGKLLNRLTYDDRKVTLSEYAYFPNVARFTDPSYKPLADIPGSAFELKS